MVNIDAGCIYIVNKYKILTFNCCKVDKLWISILDYQNNVSRVDNLAINL